jgi:hypothetical protein
MLNFAMPGLALACVCLSMAAAGLGLHDATSLAVWQSLSATMLLTAAAFGASAVGRVAKAVPRRRR